MSSERPKYIIELSFDCVDLPNLDTFSKTDPFLKVYEKIVKNNRGWVHRGNTEIIYNNLNPQFSTSVKVDFFFEEKQEFKVELYHHDGENKDLHVATCEFQLSNLMGLKDDILRKPFTPTKKYSSKSCGFLETRFDRVEKTSTLELVFRANKVKSLRLCGANNNFIEIYRPKTEYTVSHYMPNSELSYDFATCPIPESEWVLVHRTEHINNNKACDWDLIKLPKQKLCLSDESMPLKIVLKDYRTNVGNHKLVGGVLTSVSNLRLNHSNSTSMELVKDANSSGRGDLSIIKLEEKNIYDFMDYLRGGLNIALFAAIDFTGSNGIPKEKSSLHHFDPTLMNQISSNINPSLITGNKLNPYQKVILGVGEVLLDYDSDKMVPLYGFGATLDFPNNRSRETSHCFSCCGNPPGHEVEVPGLPGIFLTYNNAIQSIRLAGPTYMAPVLNKAIANTRAAMEENPDNYSFILIITDGAIHDMDATIDALAEASRMPISIVIVGVGNDCMLGFILSF